MKEKIVKVEQMDKTFSIRNLKWVDTINSCGKTMAICIESDGLVKLFYIENIKVISTINKQKDIQY